MARLFSALLGLAIGYAAGASAGLGLVTLFSPNTHDKSVETVMTAAFVTGPAGACIGFPIGLWLSRRRGGAP